MKNVIDSLLMEREEMSDGEKELLLCDLREVLGEYFECDGDISIDITKTAHNFSICILFPARRIKNFKKL